MDRWHAFVQYDQPANAEWVETLPASLRAIRRAEDIPEFVRTPHALALPPAQAASAAPPGSWQNRPKPHRSATIDHDAHEEGYDVQSIPLSQRGDPTQEDVPLEPPAFQPDNEFHASATGGERGPGSYFGSEWNNYLSFGCDAQVQDDFHTAREGCRSCFCCRPCNMAWMGIFGAVNFCACRSRDMDVSVEVRDEQGRWVALPLPPGLKSIVLLNTPTYGGGRFLWGKAKKPKKTKGGQASSSSAGSQHQAVSSSSSKPPKKWECVSQGQSIDDGLFEIVGVKSTWHLGMIMSQVSRGVRLAQVSEARLTFRNGMYAQADGCDRCLGDRPKARRSDG